MKITDKLIHYKKEISLSSIIVILSLFAILSLTAMILSTFSLYRSYLQTPNQSVAASKKSDLVIFMQSSDSKSAKVAVERAIVLKKNDAVDQIEVVFGGDGVIPVAHADEEFAARLEYANSIGITMSGCNAGLTHNNLTASDLPKFFTIFPYGIVHTLDLAAKGYIVIQD